jgi:hypothetical protein
MFIRPVGWGHTHATDGDGQFSNRAQAIAKLGNGRLLADTQYGEITGSKPEIHFV